MLRLVVFKVMLRFIMFMVRRFFCFVGMLIVDCPNTLRFSYNKLINDRASFFQYAHYFKRSGIFVNQILIFNKTMRTFKFIGKFYIEIFSDGCAHHNLHIFLKKLSIGKFCRV